MSGYTKEPWTFSGSEFRSATGYIPLVGVRIPMVAGAARDEALANARRIVACVNACAGIPTETLEIWEPSDKESFGAVYARAEKAEARLAEAERLLEAMLADIGELVSSPDHLKMALHLIEIGNPLSVDGHNGPEIAKQVRAFLEAKP